MNWIGDHQPDVAVNARAGIPAGRRLVRSVGADGQNVRPARAEVQVRREFMAETDVARRAFASDTPLIQTSLFCITASNSMKTRRPEKFSQQGEIFSIPADAAGQKSTRAAGPVGFGKRPFDAPVVRHVQLAPRTVGKIRLLRPGTSAFRKRQLVSNDWVTRRFGGRGGGHGPPSAASKAPAMILFIGNMNAGFRRQALQNKLRSMGG